MASNRKPKLALIALVLFGCSNNPCLGDDREARLCRREKDRQLPCQDEARLLATTVGSPSAFECPNRLHRMRYEVSRAVSGEEIGVMVVCECARHGIGIAGASS